MKRAMLYRVKEKIMNMSQIKISNTLEEYIKVNK